MFGSGGVWSDRDINLPTIHQLIDVIAFTNVDTRKRAVKPDLHFQSFKLWALAGD